MPDNLETFQALLEKYEKTGVAYWDNINKRAREVRPTPKPRTPGTELVRPEDLSVAVDAKDLAKEFRQQARERIRTNKTTVVAKERDLARRQAITDGYERRASRTLKRVWRRCRWSLPFGHRFTKTVYEKEKHRKFCAVCDMPQGSGRRRIQIAHLARQLIDKDIEAGVITHDDIIRG